MSLERRGLLVCAEVARALEIDLRKVNGERLTNITEALIAHLEDLKEKQEQEEEEKREEKREEEKERENERAALRQGAGRGAGAVSVRRVQGAAIADDAESDTGDDWAHDDDGFFGDVRAMDVDDGPQVPPADAADNASDPATFMRDNLFGVCQIVQSALEKRVVEAFDSLRQGGRTDIPHQPRPFLIKRIPECMRALFPPPVVSTGAYLQWFLMSECDKGQAFTPPAGKQEVWDGSCSFVDKQGRIGQIKAFVLDLPRALMGAGRGSVSDACCLDSDSVLFADLLIVAYFARYFATA